MIHSLAPFLPITAVVGLRALGAVVWMKTLNPLGQAEVLS